MRNLIEYPLTKSEVLAALDTALQREMDDDRIGGISGLAIQEAIRFIEERATDEDFRIRFESQG